MRNVAKTHHAHEFSVFTENGQPPDLVFLHDAKRVLGLAIVAAENHVAAHHVLRLDGGEVLAIGERSDGDVPVGHHADGFAALTHQHRADVVVAHLLGNGLKLGIGGDVLGALVHHVFDFHDGPPNRTFRPTLHYFAPDLANVQWGAKTSLLHAAPATLAQASCQQFHSHQA